MTQQVFADYIGLAPATLSSIFNGRTRPTLNVVEALKRKIPNINFDWLMLGVGPMYIDQSIGEAAEEPTDDHQITSSSSFDSTVTYALSDAPRVPSLVFQFKRTVTMLDVSERVSACDNVQPIDVLVTSAVLISFSMVFDPSVIVR